MSGINKCSPNIWAELKIALPNSEQKHERLLLVELSSRLRLCQESSPTLSPAPWLWAEPHSSPLYSQNYCQRPSASLIHSALVSFPLKSPEIPPSMKAQPADLQPLSGSQETTGGAGTFILSSAPGWLPSPAESARPQESRSGRPPSFAADLLRYRFTFLGSFKGKDLRAAGWPAEMTLRPL